VRVCVYTVLLGNYDQLLPQPVAADSSADFVCFTDDASLVAEGWRIELVEPFLPQDLHRSSRLLKILGHESLDAYDVTVCIDASVQLRATPEEIVASWLSEDADMAFAHHSYRTTVLEEFDEVVRLNYDDRARVYEQLTDYAVVYPDVLDARPRWGGLIVRRKNARVAATERIWFDQVMRYSRRDQLSLVVAITRGPARVSSLDVDNFDSRFHRWPVIERRRVAMGKADQYSSGPLVADIRRSRARIAELEEQVQSLAPGVVSDLRSEVERLHGEIARAAEFRRLLDEEIDALRRKVWERDEALVRTSSVRGALAAVRSAIAGRLRRVNR
jgi:hypothetical protein